ncbi:hypothetical protein H0H92_008819 [Tricholoma furcatifolium]|nr:hypothetical protein H0H92_008819 [Tricholoma furcatifolium]
MSQNTNTVKDIVAEPSTAAPLTLLEILTLLQIGGHIRMANGGLTASSSSLQQDPLAYLLNRMSIAPETAEAAPVETAPPAPDSVEAPAAVPVAAVQAAAQVVSAAPSPPALAPLVPVSVVASERQG